MKNWAKTENFDILILHKFSPLLPKICVWRSSMILACVFQLSLMNLNAIDAQKYHVVLLRYSYISLLNCFGLALRLMNFGVFL